MQKLDYPACKLLLDDLKYLAFENGKWIFDDSKNRFKINMLWLQGTIVKVSPSKDQIRLRDNETEIMICSCDTVPGGTEWMKENKYAMVFGDIEKLEGENIVVKANKISDLSHNEYFKQIWPLDCKESKWIYNDLENKNL